MRKSRYSCDECRRGLKSNNEAENLHVTARWLGSKGDGGPGGWQREKEAKER